MTHFRKLPCKLPGGSVWHNCLNWSYSRSRSRTICQRNASVMKLQKRSKFQMKNASLVNPRAGSLRKRKKAQRPTRRCVQFLGSLDGHKLSPHTHHVSKPTQSQVSSLAYWLTRSLFFPLPFPSLPFPSPLLSSPSHLLSSPLPLCHAFDPRCLLLFVSTISSDSLSTWIFGGLGEGVRESNYDWNAA